MVNEGSYDAVTLFTAKASSDTNVQPSAGLSLSNLEAAIKARIEYIMNTPYQVFDKLTLT